MCVCGGGVYNMLGRLGCPHIPPVLLAVIPGFSPPCSRWPLGLGPAPSTHPVMSLPVQGPTLQPSFLNCCQVECPGRPIMHPVQIQNKLQLDIRRHIRRFYTVSSCSLWAVGGAWGAWLGCGRQRGEKEKVPPEDMKPPRSCLRP